MVKNRLSFWYDVCLFLIVNCFFNFCVLASFFSSVQVLHGNQASSQNNFDSSSLLCLCYDSFYWNSISILTDSNQLATSHRSECFSRIYRHSNTIYIHVFYSLFALIHTSMDKMISTVEMIRSFKECRYGFEHFKADSNCKWIGFGAIRSDCISEVYLYWCTSTSTYTHTVKHTHLKFKSNRSI